VAKNNVLEREIPWSWVLLEKPPVAQLLKSFPFYGTRRLITVFTRAHHWLLSSARSIQFIPPYPISLRFILILSSHLRLGVPNDPFPSDFPSKSYMHSYFPMRATFLAHFILLDLIIVIILGEKHKLWRFSLCNFPHPITSSLFGPNNFSPPCSQSPSAYVPLIVLQ
jgi:hypothetical protein